MRPPVIRALLQHTEAEEVERLRFLPSIEAPTVLVREATEPDEARLLRMKFQREPLEPVAQCLLKANGIGLVLETHDEVVGPSNDDDVAARLASPPLVRPKVEH